METSLYSRTIQIIGNSLFLFGFVTATIDNEPQSFSATDPMVGLTELSVQVVHSTSSSESLKVSGPHS